MPWTKEQLRRFHAGAERGEPGMAKLAAEADDEARSGTLRPSLHPDHVRRAYEAVAARARRPDNRRK